LGHSEGVLVGSMAAAAHADVARFIAVAGTSISMDKIVLEQIGKVKKPVLVISGDCDLQVPPYHTRDLHKACSDGELKVISGMGHVLKTLEPDCSNKMEAYSDATLELNQDFVEEVINFIRK